MRLVLRSDHGAQVFLAVLAPGTPQSVLDVGTDVDLLRAVITAHVADDEQTSRPLAGPLVVSVAEYVRAHLADRDLSAATIAAAHHVSVRHLYAQLERAHVRLQASIREQRLERCRQDLRDPRCAHVTAAAIGARWGFADASHFGRVFRDAYGQTPRQCRAEG
jgi:AraC-like DNA-binding protein